MRKKESAMSRSLARSSWLRPAFRPRSCAVSSGSRPRRSTRGVKSTVGSGRPNFESCDSFATRIESPRASLPI